MASEIRVTLSGEQVTRFRKDGFLSVPKITTDDELEWLRGLYDQIFEQRLGEEKGMYFDLAGPKGHSGKDVLPQCLAPEQHFPELRETTYWRNATELACELLGITRDEIEFVGSDMILKPARFGRETPWHQDEAYWDPSKLYRSVSVWMPLEEATVESGCMQFVAGTHLSDVVTHTHIDDDPKVHGLMTPGQSPDGAVAVALPAGGASIHHCRMLHYAGPNRTDKPRRAYIVRIMGPSVERDHPQARPWLEERAKAQPSLRRSG